MHDASALLPIFFEAARLALIADYYFSIKAAGCFRARRLLFSSIKTWGRQYCRYLSRAGAS